MEWIRPKQKLPPQGKKILAFYDGDIYVVQRYGNYWLPIPFHDSKYSFHDEPDLWTDIYPPREFTGKVHVIVDKEAHDIDSLERHHPDVYRNIIEGAEKMWGIDQNGMD